MKSEHKRAKEVNRRKVISNKKHQLKVRLQELSAQMQKEFLESSFIHAFLELLPDKCFIVGEVKKKVAHHHKLSLEERHYLYHWREVGHSMRVIARRLGRAPSTISRELKRNTPLRSYGLSCWSRAKQAHDKACERRRRNCRRIRLKSIQIQGVIYELIKTGLTPKLASERLLLEHGIRLSHEAIYQWIYAIERGLIKYLTRKGQRYRRSGKKRSRANKRPASAKPKLSIEKRPNRANKRLEFGHWEADSVVSKQSKSCLFVVQERVSRYFFAVKLPSCSTEEATKALIRLLKPLGPDWVKSLTCDNGSEFWGYDEITKELGIPVYFCHPYTSSERGGVENRNGMLRRFFPKKTDFNHVTNEEIEEVRQKLLNRPMECLGYFTPLEVFTGKYKPMIELAA